MNTRLFVGIVVGLILAALSGTGQAQTIYNSLYHNGFSQSQIKLYDRNQRDLSQKPRPEKEHSGHMGAKGQGRPAQPKYDKQLLSRPSG